MPLIIPDDEDVGFPKLPYFRVGARYRVTAQAEINDVETGDILTVSMVNGSCRGEFEETGDAQYSIDGDSWFERLS